MKIFIDFDDMLFNTAAFKEKLIKVFLKNKVPPKEFLLTYKDYPAVARGEIKKYDPAKQIGILGKRLKISEFKIKKDLNHLLKNSPKFIFHDAKPFLTVHSKKDIFLISYGKTKFQRDKIKNCELKNFFGKIIITNELKSVEIGKIIKDGKREPFIFTDDRISQINAVKKNFPQAITFFMKRKVGRFSDKKSKYADYEIKDLREAEKIINKKKIENYFELRNTKIKLSS